MAPLSFEAVYREGDPGNGVGGCELKSDADRALTFDCSHAGELDHIVLYRLGHGIIWIVQHHKGSFSPVFSSQSGIEGYDLRYLEDHAIAFDYGQSGKLDYIALHRPGTGAFGSFATTTAPFLLCIDKATRELRLEAMTSCHLLIASLRLTVTTVERWIISPSTVLGMETFWILRNHNGAVSPVYHAQVMESEAMT